MTLISVMRVNLIYHLRLVPILMKVNYSLSPLSLYGAVLN
jgi:hypothetical protein